jgi:glycosyltransferase involved in cell wall biosynthesis
VRSTSQLLPARSLRTAQPELYPPDTNEYKPQRAEWQGDANGGLSRLLWQDGDCPNSCGRTPQDWNSPLATRQKGDSLMRKISVALCITELELGGAERCLTELALRIDRERFAPVVYCLGPRPTRDDASCVPALEAGSVEVHFLDGRHLWQFPIVARRLRQLLSRQRAQIAQSFLFHANVLGRIAARRAGVPAVLSGIRVAERVSRWHLRVDHLTQVWVDRFVCVSRSVAAFSAREGHLPPEKLVVIPNGIDVAKYPASPPANLTTFGVAPERRVVTFVGRLERQKGVEWLVESAPTWLRRVPDCDLLLVGEGSLRPRLETTARLAGVLDRIHFAGFCPDVPEILAASALLVLPSAWEGMPNVILEAMATGLPVVATDVEGVSELLGPLAQGQTVQPGDTHSLCESVVRTLGNPAMAASTGARNRQRIEQEFSIARMVRAYEDLWKSLATE